MKEFHKRLDEVRKKRLEERRKERVLERKVQRRIEKEERERKEKEERERRGGKYVEMSVPWRTLIAFLRIGLFLYQLLAILTLHMLCNTDIEINLQKVVIALNTQLQPQFRSF